MNMEVIIGEQEYTKMLELVCGILRNDGISAEIVERCVDRIIDKVDRNGFLGIEESDKAYAIRVFVAALLEATKWTEVYPKQTIE